MTIKHAVCFTHIGDRPNHEDNFLFATNTLPQEIQNSMVDKELVFFVNELKQKKTVEFYAISDGMGGYNAGEVASRVCTKRLAELENQIQNVDTVGELIKEIQNSINDLNIEICKLSQTHSELREMGATMLLLVIINNIFLIFNIGDSRAYYYNDHQFKQLTKDNTEGQRLLDLNLLKKDELDNFPDYKRLNRYLGFNRPGYTLKADEYFFKINNGNILLCSDGLTDNISNQELYSILNSNKDLTVVGKKLVQKALENKRADNITIIIISTKR